MIIDRAQADFPAHQGRTGRQESAGLATNTNVKEKN